MVTLNIKYVGWFNEMMLRRHSDIFIGHTLEIELSAYFDGMYRIWRYEDYERQKQAMLKAITYLCLRYLRLAPRPSYDKNRVKAYENESLYPLNVRWLTVKTRKIFKPRDIGLMSGFPAVRQAVDSSATETSGVGVAKMISSVPIFS